MFDSIMRSVAERRLARLKGIMEESGLDAILLFEGDWVGHKLSLTRHFSLVLLTPDSIIVLADPSLYYEAVRESPWEVKLVEDIGPARLADEVLKALPGPRLGINKVWGRGKLTFLHVDLLEALRSRGVTVTDATPALADVFDKPYEDEVPIIEWLSVTTSRAIEAAAEMLRPGMRENELAAIIDKTLEEEGIVERWFATIVASGPRAAAPRSV